uniref:Uncharacterized protein n=1 Tax=Nelumbo nucifera TaxID=4432 RepID=A0A822XW77_NELNU|nr:TPA_asm: hypothetical protein HUJ06_024874 [Nelumbo nucifera]
MSVATIIAGLVDAKEGLVVAIGSSGHHAGSGSVSASAAGGEYPVLPTTSPSILFFSLCWLPWKQKKSAMTMRKRWKMEIWADICCWAIKHCSFP